MKKYSLFLLCLMAQYPCMPNALPIILQIRPCVSTISLPEMQPDKKYAWTDCLVSPLGQEGSIIV